ncbi:MAG: type II toxin-antitoxin system RelE/ParE family toxin [Nanoarchaeales archaeon]|nr:type II toxin-antitoxin system RelE/ParE family toxin [Nanoarchaeales archaeon]
MSDYFIIWTIPARDDLENIIDFYSKDSTNYSEKLIKKVFIQIKNLEIFPKLGSKYKNLRLLNLGVYFVLYKIIENNIYILGVIHSKMDFN